MPYTHRKVGDKQCVYKKDTGEKVGCTSGSINKYLAALHANANESINENLNYVDMFNKDFFLVRIPFLKDYNFFDRKNGIEAQRVVYHENVEKLYKGDIIKFKQFNVSSEFIFYAQKIDDRTFYHFIIKNKFYPMLEDNQLDGLEKKVLMLGIKQIDEKLSYSGEIMVKDNQSIDENKLDEIFNKINEILFKVEEETEENDTPLFEGNIIKGGKADKMTAKDIADKFKLPVSKINAQITKGVKIEIEHTDNKERATEIAMDHISEFPDYYDRLETMEKDANKKWKDGKEKTNEDIKSSVSAALLGLSLMGNPQTTKGANITPMSQTQTQKVLARVTFEGSQPVSNPDLDLVHGFLGSNRLQDDFAKRVEDELKNQVKNGNEPDVSNIQVRTYVQGNKIITKASCDIVESVDGIAYAHFTTRGSIGSNYTQRHDNQVNGLINRLENYYGGVAKQVGNSIEISFKINNNTISYKQSFFVASDDKNITNNQNTKQIIGTDINDLRDKLNSETRNIYIDVNSINIDMKNYKVSYKTGDVGIHKISLLFDDSGDLDNRLKNIKAKNQTFKEIKKGRIGNLDWVISLIPYEEIKTNKMNESQKQLIKRLLREEIEEGKLARTLGTLGMAASTLAAPKAYSKDVESNKIEKIDKIGVIKNSDGSVTSTAKTDGPTKELAKELAINKAKNQIASALNLDSKDFEHEIIDVKYEKGKNNIICIVKITAML
jgi:hypothetical protein